MCRVHHVKCRAGWSTVGIKIAGRSINNFRYADDTTLMAQSEEELNSLLMKVQHTRPLYPSPTSGVYSNSCPLHWWCHPTISSSFPSPPAINLSQHQGLFRWVNSSHQGGQSIGVSASASVLPMNIQGWFPLGWTGWISLLSKGISRVFSNTTVQKHQFFGAQLSL